MKYRKLRIAFPAACSVVCLLLIGLWVRSFSHLDRLDAPMNRILPSTTIAVASVRGLLMLGVQQKLVAVQSDPRISWRLNSSPIEQIELSHLQDGFIGFKVIHDKRETGVQLPYWSAVAMAFVCSVIPWYRWKHRFSLRTLLITTTLIAILLGLIIYNNA